MRRFFGVLALTLLTVLPTVSRAQQAPQRVDIFLLDAIVVAYLSFEGQPPPAEFLDYDRDRDGTFDIFDVDRAIMEYHHSLYDLDGDGVLGQVELDCRFAPLGQELSPERVESLPGLPDGSVDCDLDGLDNALEGRLGLDALLADSDSDGQLDGDEDSDGDGLSNLDEVARGTDAGDVDTDEDTLPDGVEVQIGTDPLVPDFDGDGLLDGVEVALGLDPLLPDSDGDGTLDGAEDTDGDGLSNLDEQTWRLDPGDPDSDGDGTPDGDEDIDGDGLSIADEVARGTDPADPDSDNDGVPDGEEVAQGTDPLVCGDDVFDDNDTPGTAAPLPAADTVEGRWPNLRLCGGDQDWYSVQVQDGDTLEVELSQLSLQPNLDLAVYRGAALIAEATTTRILEQITLPDLDGGEYLVLVKSDSEEFALYDLEVRVFLPECAPDPVEPNDTAGAATPLACDAVLQGMVGCWEDDDYYAVELDGLATLSATIGFLPEAGELEIELLNQREFTIVPAGEWSGDGKVLQAQGLEPGTYFLHVYSVAAMPNHYSLAVSCAPEESPCEPDALEPNDDAATAYPIALPRASGANPEPAPLFIENLRVCDARDEDWVRFQVQAGDRIDVLAEFFHFTGDLLLELYCYGDWEQPVVVSDDTNDDEQLVWDAPEDGLCMLHLVGVPQLPTGTEYRLILQPAQ